MPIIPTFFILLIVFINFARDMDGLFDGTWI